jgi:uncharacterized protein YbjT (DUF2867 family)
MSARRKALLLGATGLVGGHCLNKLLADAAYDKVVALGRRPLPLEHEKLEQHTIDFARLAEFAPLLQTQDIFSCLGTTIRKAGTREAFREVDYTYQYEAARLAAQAGAEQLLLVSSMGANARSSIFYNRVKGELEDAVSKLPLRSVQIFRPSLLLGAREEFRRGERVSEYAMKTFSFLLLGPLEKYRPVQASAVASAMLKIAKEHPAGVNIFQSDRISALGDGA